MAKQDNWIYGYHALKNALQLHPESILRIYLQKNRNDERVQEITELAQNIGISIQKMSQNDLDSRAEGAPHQGLLAECKRRLEYNEHDLEKILQQANSNLLLLILDGVQDPHNLGACLRSADAMGAQAVIIPKDRSVGLTAVVRKVACGAAETVPLIQVTNLSRCLRELKEQGVWLVGTIAEAEATIQSIDLTGSIALVMGGEGQGLRRLTREHCDYLVKIPMQGTVESLNVSTATAICLYEAVRQRSLVK